MKSLVRQVTISVLSIELLCGFTFAGASLWHEWECDREQWTSAFRGVPTP